MSDQEKDQFIAEASRLMRQIERRDRWMLFALLMIGFGMAILGSALIYGLWILDHNDIPSKFVHYLEARI